MISICIPIPGEGLGAVKESTPVITVVMPNINGIKKIKWNTYKTTVDKIEQSSGYYFSSDVPVSIQSVIGKK